MRISCAKIGFPTGSRRGNRPLLDNFDPQKFIISMAVIILAITIHEFAHAITADRLGDSTPRRQGRLTLFPTDHLDPVGTIMMFLSSLTGFGIGWGKPVQTNPLNFRKPIRDGAIVAIAGPISNILQALVFTAIIRVVGVQDVLLQEGPLGFFLLQGLFINLSLAFFNMLPIGPLDGHWVIQALLPRNQAEAYYRWNLAYGGFIFLALVLFGRGLITSLYWPAVMKVGFTLLGLDSP
jgi:Zn-dependent protease